MFRDFLTILCMLVAASGAFAADNALTGKTLVDGDKVTVGDLFTNTGRHAGYVLAPAPQAGTSLTLSKSDLQRVADAFRLNWESPENVTVTLRRNAVAIDNAKIAEALVQSDLKNDISDDASFQITNVKLPLVFDGLEEPTIAVSKTSFDPETEKFAAIVTIARDEEILKELTVSGTAIPMVTLPVLRHTILANNVINAEDLTTITIPKRDVRSGAFRSADELVGMTPKRTIGANQVLSQNDVTPPILVKRNELISVTYQNGPVRLSTKARALDNGSKGQIIMLENTTSRKPFEAKITGPQQAEVTVDAING